MTEQEIFNQVYLGLKSQGFETSLSDNYVCAYKGTDGRKCAAGWLIPEGSYNPIIEGKDLFEVAKLDVFPNLFPMLGTPDKVEFVFDLQRVHDFSTSGSNMKARLVDFASNQYLTVPE